MDVTTALALVPPEKFFHDINVIREQYDKAYPRWMPHINFIFPFVSTKDFSFVKQRLEKNLKNFGSFKVNLNVVDHFEQRQGNNTFHLAPSDCPRLTELMELISQTLPLLVDNNKKFKPHLTLAQSDDVGFMEKKLKKYFQSKPVEFEVTHLSMLVRSKEDGNVPFSVVHEISIE